MVSSNWRSARVQNVLLRPLLGCQFRELLGPGLMRVPVPNYPAIYVCQTAHEQGNLRRFRSVLYTLSLIW